MTSLLVAVREDEGVMKQYGDLVQTHECICSVNLAEYDKTLLRAAVREIARRVRETAQSYIGDGHPEIACEWLNAADFMEGLAE